jgi:hypothetical protein
MDSHFTYQFRELQIYDDVLDHVLNAPDGEVGKHLYGVGLKIIAAAKAQVGVDTTQLRESIHMIHRRAGVGQELWIGSDVAHAYMHHEGTPPHRISPRADHQFLRFSNGGRVIYAREVMHPGTQPNRYLSDNLVLVRV